MANNTLAPDEVLGDPVQVPQQAAPQNTQASQLNDDEVLGDPVQVAQAPQVGAGVTGIAPREEGIWDRTKRVIEDNIPSLSSRTVYDPEYGKQGFIALKSAMTPTEQTEHPILSETLGTLDNLATPANVSIMAATGGLGTLSTPEATAAANVIGKYLPRAISGYFAAQQGWDAVKQTPELYDAMFAKGKYADMSDKDRALEVERLTTRIVETGAVGALAGQHALGVEATPTTEVGKRAQAIADQTGLRVRQALRSDQRAMTVAVGNHQATSAMLDQRLAEQQIATEQSVKATKAAEDAKVLFDEGHIGQQELDQANNRASAAAANAGKATKAVVDAHEAHAAAETEVGRMTRKLTQPSTTDKIKTAYGSTVDALGAMLGRTNDFDTAQKRAMKITPKQKLAYDQKIANVREDLQAILNEHPTIDSPKSYADKIDQHIQTQETALQKQAGASKGSDDPVVPNITQRLIDRLDTFFDDNKGLYGDDEDVANAKSEIIEGILQSRNGEHLLEPNLFEAENVRRRLGREGSSQFKPNAIPTTDAYKAGALEAADELRAAIDESYDAKGVKGVKEWRGKEANLIDIRDRLYDAQDKAEKAGKGGVINSLMKKIGVPSTVIAIALGHPVSGAAIGAAVLGDQILQNLTNPNVNLQRAIDIASRNPNARTTVPSRTNTPLHSALAGYFGEFLGQSSYADLQARFAENIADKTRHNVPLEAKDQKILDMLNDAQQKDQVAIQKQRDEAKKNAPKITSATLPEDYEVPMHIDGDMPNNMQQHQALVHDIVHAIVADRVGLKPVDGIRAGTGKSLLSAPLDLSEFLDENGELIPDKIRPRIADIAATYVAGGVANDIWHGVPLTENEGVGADFSILDKFMDAAGFSKAERSRIIAEQTDRVRDFLDQPNVRKIIDQHAQVREARLANTHHFSEDRINQVIKDVRGATNAEPARNTARATGDVHQAAKGNVPGGQEGGKRGPAAGVQPEGNRPASSEGGTVKEGEGANNAATAGGRGPEGQGPAEGKGGSTERTATGNEPAAGTDLNPELSNIEVKPADKENPGSFFDNMGINRHTITVNGEPIAKVHTYLHDNGNLDITWLGEQGGQPGRGGAEGKLGTVGIRQVAAQLKELYPEAKKIEYVREGGLVGENFGTRGNIINIRDLNPQLKEDEVKPFKVEWKPNGKYGVVNPKGITLQEFPTREAAEAEAYRAAKQSKEVKVQQQNLHPQLEENKQGGHAGGEVASEEELNRPGRFVKISRSGQPTDQGKVPDFNLREGEAGYQVKPDGSYELKSGIETPLTKRGVEGYAKEVFPNRTTSAEAAGGRTEDVAGREGGGAEAPRPATQEELNPKLEEKKDKVEQAIKDAADTNGRGFTFHPQTGEVPKDGYMVETFPEADQSYDHPPTTDDIHQYIEKNKKLLNQHPELYVGGYKNTLGISGRYIDPVMAEHAAKRLDQISMYDLGKKKEIPTNGTGKPDEYTLANYSHDRRIEDLNRTLDSSPYVVMKHWGKTFGEIKHGLNEDDYNKYLGSRTDDAWKTINREADVDSKGYVDDPETLNKIRQIVNRDDPNAIWLPVKEKPYIDEINKILDSKNPLFGKSRKLSQINEVLEQLRSDRKIPIAEEFRRYLEPGLTGRAKELRDELQEKMSAHPEDFNPKLSAANKQQAKDVLDRIAEEYGKSSDASKVQHGASFIHPDGKFSHLGTDDHQQVMFKHGFDAGTDDDRVPFINNSGAVRTNSWTGRQGRTLSFSVPNTGVTPEQIDSMKRAVVPYRSNGQVRIETADTPTQVRNQIKDFPTGNDVEPMLRQIGAHPEGAIKSPDDMLRAELKTELGITGDDPRNGLPNKVLAKQVAAQRAKQALNPQLGPRGSSVPLMKNPLKIEGTGEEGKVNTLDVAKALNQYTKNKLPSLEIGKTEPAEQVERAKKIMEDEAKYQLAQNDTGKAWYTTDMKDHDKVLQGIRPELNVPAKLSMFKMAEAILSSGMKPDSNVKAALNAWDAYQDTGKFPAKNPETGQSWGPRGVKAYGNALDMLNRLIDEKGEQGASDWLLQEHPIKELRQYNTSSTGGHGGGVAGKADDTLPGAYIFGRKRGPFAQNLHGIESAFTADMWVSRSWNRWMGTNEVTPDGELQDAPRSQKEQNLMKQSFSETADKLKLTTSELQAVLWYFEQSLYDVHGAKKETWSYSDAARKAADDDASTFKFGANVHPGIEALAGTR